MHTYVLVCAYLLRKIRKKSLKGCFPSQWSAFTQIRKWYPFFPGWTLPNDRVHGLANRQGWNPAATSPYGWAPCTGHRSINCRVRIWWLRMGVALLLYKKETFTLQRRLFYIIWIFIAWYITFIIGFMYVYREKY